MLDIYHFDNILRRNISMLIHMDNGLVSILIRVLLNAYFIEQFFKLKDS